MGAVERHFRGVESAATGAWRKLAALARHAAAGALRGPPLFASCGHLELRSVAVIR
jgi:hypothetical protein